jgi:pyroglutamyl-peptidase
LILVTAFGPFPGAPVNPTPAILARLTSPCASRRLGVDLAPVILATAYQALPKFAEVIESLKPDAIVHLGLAGRAKTIRVEAVARNRAAPYRRDAVGAAPERMALNARHPARLSTPLAARALKHRIAANAPAAVSTNAGDYLCNALYWQSLASGQRAVFIHVPRPSIMVPIPRMARALEPVLAAVVGCLTVNP